VTRVTAVPAPRYLPPLRHRPIANIRVFLVWMGDPRTGGATFELRAGVDHVFLDV